MAVQVTGYFKHELAIYENPQLRLIPHLTLKGKIAMDVQVAVPVVYTEGPNIGQITYQTATNIYMYPTTAELVYPKVKKDPYSDLIHSLETYVINQVSDLNPNCTFNRV